MADEYVISAKDLTLSSELLSSNAISGKYDKTGGIISGNVIVQAGSYL